MIVQTGKLKINVYKADRYSGFMKCVLPFPWFECCKLPAVHTNTAPFPINSIKYWFSTLRCERTIHTSSMGCNSFCLSFLVTQQYLHKRSPLWPELMGLSDMFSLLLGVACDCALTSDVFGCLCHVFGDSPCLFSALPVLRDGGVPFAPRKPGAGNSAPQLVSDSRRERKHFIFCIDF